MGKIICSLEEWDSIIDYYRPNCSSKTWYIRELKQLSRPLMWGDWNILSESNEMFDLGVFKSIITPTYSDNIQYVPFDEIGDSKHIYIINIYNSQFFNENFNLGFTTISRKYLDDIRNGKSKILMFFLYEGYSGSKHNDDLDIIEKWRVEANLPEGSVYYVSGNLLCQNIVEQKGLGFKGRGVHNFEPWNKYEDQSIVEFIPKDDKFLFLSYNRAPRLHRIVLAIDLLKENLFEKGKISLNKPELELPTDTPEDIAEFLLKKTPIYVDTKNDLTYNLAVNITKEDYQDTFISVVTETLADEDTLFFSEKIWKPIMVGHPFLLYGNRYSLKYLKSLGYKTFDKWIDESYDLEVDSQTRSKMIVQELKKFSAKSIDELKMIREEMKEVCVHNKNLYNELYKVNYYNSDMSTKINNILNEVWGELN